MTCYDTFESPFGPFSIAVGDSGAVLATCFDTAGRLEGFGLSLAVMERDAQRVAHVRQQLEEYFRGDRTRFDLVLAPSGTPFRQRVWQALLEIPYGETRSYGQLARTLGSSPRAVGGANGANPLCPIVPCHRVIGADGSLTGFGYGVDLKKRLLEHEARVAATKKLVTV